MQARRLNQSVFKRIHIEVTDQNCSTVSSTIFFFAYLACQYIGFRRLIGSIPIYFTRQMDRTEQKLRFSQS